MEEIKVLKKREGNRRWYLKNQERLLKKAADRRASIPKEVRSEYHRQWVLKNPEWHKNYCAKRKREDPLFKLKHTLRNRLYIAVKRAGANKHKKTFDLLGCNLQELKTHLEAQFQEGMTWDNHGEWEIDHIKPCDAFDLLLEADQKACFHYTNLQPMWASENRIKSNKWLPQESTTQLAPTQDTAQAV